MSILTNEILKFVIQAEQGCDLKQGKYRLHFHLMPPIGWLNDPNGLSQFKGKYYVFFQYTPFDPKGGLKVWGLYTSKDLIHWNYEGTPVLPDEAWDCHGAYSGSALIEDGNMHLYYTGNVKFPGDFDYVHEGRGSNTILMSSEDGRTFSAKKCVLTNEDYPKSYTNHIRDPKVWKEKDTYYMVLGGRKNDDRGAVLLYESSDGAKWFLQNEITSHEKFGYMWECPDLMEMDGEWFLSLSPQGVEREEYRNQNIYLSGYFAGAGDYRENYELSEFTEWDMGFDFYAPQTFVDEQGRRILIGWCGLPDIDKEYTNATLEEGWQHALTVPRVVTKHGKRLYQYPVEELKALRSEENVVADGVETCFENGTFDLEMNQIKCSSFKVLVNDGMELAYENQVFALRFLNDMGCGRTERKAKIDKIHSMRILCDTSMIEVYVNEGEYVFTSRFYTTTDGIKVNVMADESCNTVWSLGEMEVKLK